MKALRWILYALIGLVGMPLLLEVLQPAHSSYSTKSIWYTIQGLGPLFTVFLFVAFLHVAVAVFVAPCKKKGASIFAAVWTVLFGALVYGAHFMMDWKFWMPCALGSIIGASGGLYFVYRYIRKKEPNQSLEPTRMDDSSAIERH